MSRALAALFLVGAGGSLAAYLLWPREGSESALDDWIARAKAGSIPGGCIDEETGLPVQMREGESCIQAKQRIALSHMVNLVQSSARTWLERIFPGRNPPLDVPHASVANAVRNVDWKDHAGDLKRLQSVVRSPMLSTIAVFPRLGPLGDPEVDEWLWSSPAHFFTEGEISAWRRGIKPVGPGPTVLGELDPWGARVGGRPRVR